MKTLLAIFAAVGKYFMEGGALLGAAEAGGDAEFILEFVKGAK